MVEIGLTGGIASGKSTVANFFKELGAYLIDWDVLAHEVVHPYLKAWEGIVKYFGKEVLNEDLTINRQRLGEIVFNDKGKLEKLNQIVHPEVFKEDERRVDKIRRLNSEAVIIKDIPLLIEVGLERFVDKVVVVYASEEIQIKRLAERGIQPEEAKKRIKAQQPLEEKVKFADFVIYNNGSLKETREQVERIYSIIKKEVTASCLKKSYSPRQFEEVVKDGEAMYRKILLEVELGQRGVEKCNIAVYLEGKLIGSYFDKSYNNLPEMANELRAKYQDAVIEAWCLGDDCTGRTHRWKVDI